MSNVLWINAEADTSVGSATIESDDETFTITDHGLVDGDRVVVSNLSGGAGGVLAENGVYWVRDAMTNTFTVSLTRAGLPIEFGTDGGADVDIFQPTYNAPELRRLFSAFLAHGSPDAFHSRFGARQGVFPTASSDSIVQFPSNENWSTRDLVAVVNPELSSDDGPYIVVHPSDAGSINPADGSNDRIDRLDLQVQDDDEDSSGFRRARIVYTAGTPDASPSAPTQADNSLELSTFRVLAAGAGLSNQTQPNLTVSRGGILPVRDDTEQSSDNSYPGYSVWKQDTEELEVDTSGSGLWVPIAQAGGWEVIHDVEYPDEGVDLAIPSGLYFMIRIHMWGALNPAGEWCGVSINDDQTSGLHERHYVSTDPGGSGFDDNVSDNGTAWRLARWSGVFGNSAVATIFGTDEDNVLTYISEGHQVAGGTDFRRHSWANGQLAASRLLTHLTFYATSTSDFEAGTRVMIEGYRPRTHI